MPARRKTTKPGRPPRYLTAEQPAESTASDIQNICKHGDVVLVCGEEKRRFRVSSHLLRASCEVLDRMFSLDFSEGQNLSPSEPKEIMLPDDDPKAMEIICNIIHLNNDQTPDKLGAGELLVLGRLVDKYDLHRAAYLAMDKLLSVGEPATCLVVARLLNYDKQFRQITSKLIYHTHDDFQDIVAAFPEEDLFPVLFQMERLRSGYRRVINTVINNNAPEDAYENNNNDDDDDDDDDEGDGGQGEPCNNCYYKANFAKECRYLRRRINRPGYEHKTLGETVALIDAMPHRSKDLCKLREGCPQHANLAFPISKRFWDTTNTFMKSSYDYPALGTEMHGLCLSCTQAGKSTTHTALESCPTDAE